MGSILGSGFGGGLGRSLLTPALRLEILSILSVAGACRGVRLVSDLTSSLTADVMGIGGGAEADGLGVSRTASLGEGAPLAGGTREVIERIGERSSAGLSSGGLVDGFASIFGIDFDESGVLPPPIVRGTLSVVERIGSEGRAVSEGLRGIVSTALGTD